MNSRWRKADKYGTVLYPGDICVRSNQGKVEYVIYKKESFGGEGSKGEYGRFEGLSGPCTIKFSNVAFAFDPMGERRAEAKEVNHLVRSFYG